MIQKLPLDGTMIQSWIAKAEAERRRLSSKKWLESDKWTAVRFNMTTPLEFSSMVVQFESESWIRLELPTSKTDKSNTMACETP